MKYERLVERLSSLSNQQAYSKEGVCQKLFKHISPDNFRKLINHALKHKNQFKNGSYCYFEKSPVGSSTLDPYFLACSYEVYYSKGKFYLIIQTKSKKSEQELDEKGNLLTRKKMEMEKESGTYKSGCDSFCLEESGITEYFTLVAREKCIASVEREQKFLEEVKSHFLQFPLFGAVRTKQNEKRMSISAPKAVSDGENADFKTMYSLLVGIKSVALGLSDISKAGKVHQDLKPKNLLLMPNGIIKIIDFGFSTSETEGNSEATAGYLAPEKLAALVENQRLALLKRCKLDKYKEILENLGSAREPLSKRISIINEIGLILKIKPDYRYAYHIGYNKECNEYPLQIWEAWESEKRDVKLSMFPDRQQDVWGFAMTVWELLIIASPKVEIESPKLSEKILPEIKNLLTLILNAPPGKRLSVDDFIREFDKLLSKHGLLTAVNKPIEAHIAQCQMLEEKPKAESSTPPLSPANSGLRGAKKFTLFPLADESSDAVEFVVKRAKKVK